MYSSGVPGSPKAAEQMQGAASMQHHIAEQMAASKIHKAKDQMQFQRLGPRQQVHSHLACNTMLLIRWLSECAPGSLSRTQRWGASC